MTGLELYRDVQFAADANGLRPPSAQWFASTLNRVIDDLNSRAKIYWKRVYLPTGVRSASGGWTYMPSRYWRIDPAGVASRSQVTGVPLSIIRAAISGGTGGSGMASKQLSIQRGQQFAGVGHSAATDGSPGAPNCIWLDQDPSLGWYLIGLDPRPNALYWVHMALQYRTERYTNLNDQLPGVAQGHQVMFEGVLSAMTEAEQDFHRKSFHVEHAAKYERGVIDVKQMVERMAIHSFSVSAMVGRNAGRDESF